MSLLASHLLFFTYSFQLSIFLLSDFKNLTYHRKLSVAEVELSHQLLSDTAAATAAGPQVLSSLLMRPTRNARWSSSMRRTGRSGDTRSNGSDADSDPYVLVHRLCGLVDPSSSSSPLSPPPATAAVVGYLIVESDRRIGETELASILAAVHIVSSVVRAKLARWVGNSGHSIVSLHQSFSTLHETAREYFSRSPIFKCCI